jgi:hypothetical protein
MDDPMLMDNNIKAFKSEKLYDFAMVRCDYSSASIRCRVAYLNLPLFMQNVIMHS